MSEAIRFGRTHTQEVVNVYNDQDHRIGAIRRMEGKENYIWFPSFNSNAKHRFIVLNRNLEVSKELVKQLINKGI